MVGVILLHAAGQWIITSQEMNQLNPVKITCWAVVDIYQTLGVIAVPLFLMLTGALLLQPQKKNESLTVYFKKRWARIGLPFFFWSARNKQSSSSDIIRVECVGDSLTQSSGYPYELWKLLGSKAPYTMGNYSIGPDDDNGASSNGTRFAVGNFGAGSTTVLLNTETPYMNTSVFQSALEYQANIVIIMLGTNDLSRTLSCIMQVL
jgi:hypothetical protein